VWDGFGLRLAVAHAAVAADLDVPAGRYRVSMRAESVATTAVPATVDLVVGGANMAHASWPTAGIPITLAGVAVHGGGKLRVELRADSEIALGTDREVRLWISSIEVEPDRP
jgi:hypothetical protein